MRLRLRISYRRTLSEIFGRYLYYIVLRIQLHLHVKEPRIKKHILHPAYTSRAKTEKTTSIIIINDISFVKVLN